MEVNRLNLLKPYHRYSFSPEDLINVYLVFCKSVLGTSQKCVFRSVLLLSLMLALINPLTPTSSKLSTEDIKPHVDLSCSHKIRPICCHGVNHNSTEAGDDELPSLSGLPPLSSRLPHACKYGRKLIH